MSAGVETQAATAIPEALTEKPSVEPSKATTQIPSRPASVASSSSFKSTVSRDPQTAATTPSSAPRSHGPTKIPLTALCSGSKPPGFPEISTEQEKMYAQVLAVVSEWKSAPESTSKHAKEAPLTADERMWLTRECLLRYLRATKWKVPDAIKRLQSTISWRREYGANTFTADYISPENETGKQVVMGWDDEGRTCLYLSPGRQNTKMSDKQMQHLCYMLDRTLDMLPPGQEKTCMIINFKGAGSSGIPTVGQARAFLNILQNHNPERLGKALITERKNKEMCRAFSKLTLTVPWYVNTFFKLIAGFIDPVTREKMKFQPNNADYVPKEQLWNERGGDLEFEYDHKLYWPALNDECQRRREAYRERWIDGGQRVGEYESYLRGGSQKSLAEEERLAEESLAAETAKVSVADPTDTTS